ncbi:MAG: xanthine dehydrogenase family protein molybdopterin-binding subunit [Candidatus Eisenbacteria bacterium]|nr:xanthine dehydrogenase family protein molybdopterin-binding subunit [Candidatus Eisenbacteria bacterium]
MPRVIRTKVEVEGCWSEKVVIVDGDDLRSWPAGSTSIVGAAVPRVDGADRAAGRATYTQDVQLSGMWHARVLRSPHAHARIRKINTRAALESPGVHGVLTHRNAPKIPWYLDSFLFDPHLRYAGEEVAAVLAESEAEAEAALRLIDVTYDVLPAVTDPEAALAKGAPKLRASGNLAGGASGCYARGSVEAGLDAADLRIESSFRTAGALHNALETHGSVARWDGDDLILWDSTQYIFGIRQGVAEKLGLALNRVRVLCPYMGGGFGAKNSVRKYMVIAALFARESGRPVRAVLDRVEENLSTGHRHETVTHVRLGVTKDGHLTALEAITSAGGGAHAGGMMPVGGPFRELYACPNVTTEERAAQVNLGPQAAFRAPGYVEGTFALESSIDIAARELKLDPLEFRRRNISRLDPAMKVPYTRSSLGKVLDAGATALARWPRLIRRAGDIARGRGLAAAIWGVGGGPPAQATVMMQADGTLTVLAGTQDLGTGTKTVLAQVAAEEFGIPLANVRVTLGDTGVTPHGPASWGSITVPSMAPAVRLAAADAREQVEALLQSTQTRPGRGSRKPARATRRHRITLAALADLRKTLGDFTIVGRGSRWPNPEGKRVVGFAAQWVEVAVDRVTGEIRVTRAISVHDCGRVLNDRLATSQVEGGFIQGLGFALMEGRRVDPITHRVLNPSLLDYKVPTIRDVPPIEVIFLNEPDAAANNTGAIGIGEPPVIPTAAAIGNAVADALDIRLTETPFTPRRVLDALAAARKEQS